MTNRSEWIGEVNLWGDPDLAERIAFLRGVILTNYAHVEQTINAVAIRASSVPQYGDLLENLPVPHSERVKFLRNVAELEGPLTPFGFVVSRTLDRFERSAPTRHRMAHAHVRIMGRRDPTIEFREITRRRPRDPIVAAAPRITPEQLETMARASARLSRLCQRLVQELDRRQLLPPLAGD